MLRWFSFARIRFQSHEHLCFLSSIFEMKEEKIQNYHLDKTFQEIEPAFRFENSDSGCYWHENETILLSSRLSSDIFDLLKPWKSLRKILKMLSKFFLNDSSVNRNVVENITHSILLFPIDVKEKKIFFSSLSPPIGRKTLTFIWFCLTKDETFSLAEHIYVVSFDAPTRLKSFSMMMFLNIIPIVNVHLIKFWRVKVEYSIHVAWIFWLMLKQTSCMTAVMTVQCTKNMITTSFRCDSFSFYC